MILFSGILRGHGSHTAWFRWRLSPAPHPYRKHGIVQDRPNPFSSSSANSTASVMAFCPPAMIPITNPGAMPKADIHWYLHPQPAAGSGTNVKQPAPGQHPVGNHRYQFFNLRNGSLNSKWNFLISSLIWVRQFLHTHLFKMSVQGIRPRDLLKSHKLFVELDQNHPWELSTLYRAAVHTNGKGRLAHPETISHASHKIDGHAPAFAVFINVVEEENR